MFRLPRVRVELFGAHPSTRRGPLFGLAAFALWAAAPRPVAAQLSVDKLEMSIERRAAAPDVGAFTVTNESDSVVQARIYLMDWSREESGELRFTAVGSVPQSCARYVQVFPLSLRLPPHTSQAVRVGLAGADSLPTACWSIAFVEVANAGAGTGRRIDYITRIGVKIYVIPPGLAKDGEVEEMAIVRAPTGAARAKADTSRDHVTVAFRNSGGLPLIVKGTVEFRRIDNSVAAHDTVQTVPVLPGARRRINVPLPALASGHYIALVLLDFGGAEVAAGQIPLDVP
ncbi:MAG TPA: hypothetical protein VI139_08445 [Gemmatimonadales bacterium]